MKRYLLFGYSEIGGFAWSEVWHDSDGEALLEADEFLYGSEATLDAVLVIGYYQCGEPCNREHAKEVSHLRKAGDAPLPANVIPFPKRRIAK